jgi:DNA recombination protein RmuC
METILSFVAGLVLASFITYLFARKDKANSTALLVKDLEHTQKELADVRIESEKQLAGQKAEFERRSNEQREQLEKQFENMLNQQKESNRQALETQRELFGKSIEEMKASVKSTTEETLKHRQDEFAKSSEESLSHLLDPLKQNLKDMKQSVEDNKEKQISLQSAMETQIKSLIDQTNKTSESANSLADALKNRGKVHGDWGEQVLEDILTGSGLIEGVQYEKQQNVKDEDNANLRPDVIVHLPDKKNIIIDSKASLKAYADAMNAPTEEQRIECMKEHFRSVKKHVDELADKNYPKLVDNALPYVFMFIPNEGAYVMALNHDPGLLQYAYKKGILIVNPTNLMMALNIVLISWQQTQQEDNCKKIIELANGMYDKLINVVDSFSDLGNQLTTASKTYAKGMSQLSEGNGNLLGRAQKLKGLGITSTKKRSKVLAKGMADALPEATETEEVSYE